MAITGGRWLIQWLMMVWFLVSPGYQQSILVSYILAYFPMISTKYFSRKYPWCKHILIFLQRNSALTGAVMVMPKAHHQHQNISWKNNNSETPYMSIRYLPCVPTKQQQNKYIAFISSMTYSSLTHRLVFHSRYTTGCKYPGMQQGELLLLGLLALNVFSLINHVGYSSCMIIFTKHNNRSDEMYSLNHRDNVDGLVQDCIISIANALKILWYCTKPSMWCIWYALMGCVTFESAQSHYRKQFHS